MGETETIALLIRQLYKIVPKFNDDYISILTLVIR